MMGPNFHLPRTVADALQLLTVPDARPLAGGASMVAMMNAGLLAPATIVSLKNIASLCGIEEDRDGTVRIGAMTRHRQTAEDERLSGILNCIRVAARSIGNPVIRNMGTIGGSVSLADPGADYPAALVALQAVIQLESINGVRRLPAAEFFVDWYGTAARAHELVTAVLLPAAGAGIGFYYKLARVAGDFAIASIALCISRERGVSVAIGGCGPTPTFSADADAMLSERIDDAAIVRRAGELLAGLANPVDDVRASADYRRRIIPRLLDHAMRTAAAQSELAA